MTIPNSSSSDITTSTQSMLVAPRSSSRRAASVIRSLSTWNCSAITRPTRFRRFSILASKRWLGRKVAGSHHGCTAVYYDGFMADDTRLRRFAVLIDADNTSPRIVAGLFEEIARFGEASVRRIYGDFSSPRMKSWADILQKYAIDPHQQFAYTTGKNASDIALVIDAMDLLHSGRFDGFCLVSSDSDFTRLASRLREQGADVYGFGERKTPESFRQACRRFIYTENLLPDAQVATLEEGPSTKALQPPSAAIPILNKAIMQMETEDGWVGLGAVGQRLANIASDFDPRTFGYRKLSDLVRNTGGFEIDQSEGRALKIRPARAARPADNRAPGASSAARSRSTRTRSSA